MKNQMYERLIFKETRQESIEKLIRDNSFATVFCQGEQSSFSHLPLVLTKNDKNESEIFGHMARLNPQWQQMQKAGQCTAIFHGPHAYISPAWYPPSLGNVPTWNYAVVHVQGKFELISDPKEAFEILRMQTDHFESQYQTGWQLPEDISKIEDLVSHIVVFKLTDLFFEAKFKLSQQQKPETRRNVIEKLKEQGLSEIADYMQNDTSKG